MRIFVIPSWYPSRSNPILGIFNQEQAIMLARERPQWSVGVSVWGQGDERFLLRAKELRSLKKAFKKHDSSQQKIGLNLIAYFSPAFIWTRKFRKGNIQGIINSNERNLNQFALDFGPADVIWAQASYPASVVAQNLSDKYGIPYIVMAQMSPWPFKEFLGRNNKLKSILSTPLNKANLLLATSNMHKKTMESYGLRSIELVNYAIDTDRFKPGRPNGHGDKVVMLCVGRIEEQKGIDLLLQAVSKVSRAFELRIGGDGGLTPYYQKMASELGLENKVTWLGQLSRTEVVAEMQQCSFYVLSSRHETFGNVVLEAMACGKPVLVTKCGGPEEFVGNHGYVAEIDASDIRKNIELMIDNYLSFSSEKIRNDVMKKFGPSAWTDRMEELFTKVLSK